MIIGNLTAAPKTRFTQNNTAVCSFSVATNERYKDRNGEYQGRTEFHRVVAWSRLAEICQQYLRKGSLVYIEGSIQTKEWEDKEGQKRYTTEIIARQMTMLDSKQEQSKEENKEQSKAPVLDASFDNMEDDLPF